MARRRLWTRKKRQRARRKAEVALKKRRETQEATRDRHDTGYAGLIPVAQYSHQILKVRPRLPAALSMKKGRNATYKPEDEAMAYVGSQIAGIARLEQLDLLLPEGMLARALGLPQWMSENTQRRFLARATEETLSGVDGLIRKLVEEEALRTSDLPIEVDGDVTGVPQRARKREGVESGYCGGRVRPCYQQPRVTVNGFVWWTDLRPGRDACRDVLERTLETARALARKYPDREIFWRVDGYWASKANLRASLEASLENPQLTFLTAIHDPSMKKGRWEELVAQGAGRWTKVNSTTEILELGEVRPWGEETPPVRAVAVRRRERHPKQKKARGREKRFFSELWGGVTSEVSDAMI